MLQKCGWREVAPRSKVASICVTLETKIMHWIMHCSDRPTYRSHGLVSEAHGLCLGVEAECVETDPPRSSFSVIALHGVDLGPRLAEAEGQRLAGVVILRPVSITFPTKNAGSRSSPSSTGGTVIVPTQITARSAIFHRLPSKGPAQPAPRRTVSSPTSARQSSPSPCREGWRNQWP